MRKPAFILALVFALFSVLPACNASKEEVRKASEESKELAGSAIEKLIQDTVDFPGFLSSTTVGVEERIYLTACSVAPEIPQLEAREDGALALLEKYEEYLESARSYDWQAMDQRMKRRETDPGYAWRYEDEEGYRMWRFPSVMEGLFARIFYVKLDRQQRERFLAVLEEIYNNYILPLMGYTGDDACYSDFFLCDGEKLITDHDILIVDGEVHFRKNERNGEG